MSQRLAFRRFEEPDGYLAPVLAVLVKHGGFMRRLEVEEAVFGDRNHWGVVIDALRALQTRGWVVRTSGRWQATAVGIAVSQLHSELVGVTA